MRLGVALSTAAFALSCASASLGPSPAPRPSPVTRTPARPAPYVEPAEIARWEALNRDLAAALEAAGTRCNAVASAMRGFVQTHGAELSSAFQGVAAWEATAPPIQVEALHRRVFPAIEVRIDAGIRCKDDKAAIEAYDRFFQAAGLDAR